MIRESMDLAHRGMRTVEISDPPNHFDSAHSVLFYWFWWLALGSFTWGFFYKRATIML